MRVALLFAVAVAVVGLVGCTTYRDQLTRGDKAFEANDLDRSLALLRDIEHDFRHLSPAEQADYAYVRGMADYTVGYKADARHWLAVAKACEEATPGSLSADRKTKGAAALTELNNVVFNDGTAALVNARKDEPRAAPAEKGSVDKKAAKPAKPTKPKPNPEVPPSDD